jgi:hypothetical protein
MRKRGRKSFRSAEKSCSWFVFVLVQSSRSRFTDTITVHVHPGADPGALTAVAQRIDSRANAGEEWRRLIQGE